MSSGDDPGVPLGPIDSEWLTREPMVARLVDVHWKHQGDQPLPARTRLRYMQFASIYDTCFAYDWAWHFLTILDGPAAGRRMVLYSGAFDPPAELLDPA